MRHQLLLLLPLQAEHVTEDLSLVVSSGLAWGLAGYGCGERAGPGFLVGKGLIGDGGCLGATVFEVGDVLSEDSLAGEVPEPTLHRFSNMKLS